MPLDFFLWKYIKTKVYKAKVNDIADLKERIEQEMKALQKETLENVVDSLLERSNFVLVWMVTLSSGRYRKF